MITWERLAEQSQGTYDVTNYQQAAYRLMTEQVIYATDRGSRAAYDLLVKHLPLYVELLERFGVSMIHNAYHSYVAAVPTIRVAEKMRIVETRLALVLRWLYDQKMHAADITDGEAFIGLEELGLAYKDKLGRELPDRGELRDLATCMKRCGIARIEDPDDGQPFQIVVRPGIVEVLGETALLQLAAHAPEVASEDVDEAA